MSDRHGRRWMLVEATEQVEVVPKAEADRLRAERDELAVTVERRTQAEIEALSRADAYRDALRNLREAAWDYRHAANPTKVAAELDRAGREADAALEGSKDE